MDIDLLRERIDDLLAYYEITESSSDSNWPTASVYHGGEYHTGIIDEELFTILTDIRDILSTEE